MSQRASLLCASALVLALSTSIGSLRAATGAYDVEDIGPAEMQTVALALNESGLAAGYGTDASFARLGFRDDGAPVLLAGPDGPITEATSINDAGMIAGYAAVPFGPSYAVRYDPATGTAVALDDVQSFAWGINTAGTVVGAADALGTGLPQAVRWNPDGTRTALGSLGGLTSQARAINDAGVIVGDATTATNYGRAFRYVESSGMTALQSLEGFFDSARAVNAAGQAVGYASAPNGSLWRAVSWSASGDILELGTLGGLVSAAYGINGAGDIVGWSLDASNRNRAFLVSGGVMVDLNSLLPADSGWVLTHAYDINDGGQIVGAGVFEGRTRAFRLTPSLTPPVDATPPVMTSLAASPNRLWPPNHQMVQVGLVVQATDDSSEAPVCAVSQVASSDPDNGTGDGDTAGDIRLTGPLSLELRAERSANGRVRDYVITVECTDGAGNSTSADTTVSVTK